MPHDLQNPFAAEGARRVFGLRGRLPFQLDETISPVVIAADSLALPPFRVDGRRWMTLGATGAVAAQNGFLAVGLQNPDHEFTVDHIQLTAGASAMTFLYGLVGAGGGLGSILPNLTANTSEAGNLFAQTPVVGQVGTTATPNIRNLGVIQIPGAVSRDLILPEPLRLLPGLDQAFIVMAQTVNVSCTIALGGRYWPLR